MAEIADLKSMLDLYGVGVRAGAITPTLEDEIEFRRLIGLPELSASARADWAKTGNVRKPITLAVPGSPTPAGPVAPSDGEE